MEDKERLEALHTKYGDVEVLCIPDVVFNTPIFSDKNTVLFNQFLEEYGVWVPRYKAEIDTTYRQVIPYCLLRCSESYLIMRRKRGDDRLVGQMSLGVGGHIEKTDGDINSQLLNIGMMRELHEEVSLNAPITGIKQLGIIRGNIDEIARVHIGIVYRIDIASTKGTDIKEVDELEGFWLNREDIISHYMTGEGTAWLKSSKWESWSVIAIDRYIK